MKRRFIAFLENIRISYIVVLGLILRLTILIVLPNNEFYDSHTYFQAGRDLFETGIINSDIVMPLYPIISYVMGSLLLLKLFDIGVSVVTIWIMYRFSLLLLDNREIALIAAAITAVYPHFLFYSGTALTETTYIFLVLLSFYFLYLGKTKTGSLILVLSILERPVLELLAPIIVLSVSYFVHDQNGKKVVTNVLSYLLIYFVLLSPWWFHNYIKYGEFVRLNFGDGVVWYSGNNPMNQSGGGVAGFGKPDDMDMSVFAHITDPKERNIAMKEAAFNFIKENPDRFIVLAGKKFVRFWRLWPYTPDYEQWKYIILSLFSYGVVLALSLHFFFTQFITNWRRLVPIVLLILYLTAVHMVLIASIRYRLPLEPFLIIFASHSAWNIFRKYSGRTVAAN